MSYIIMHKNFILLGHPAAHVWGLTVLKLPHFKNNKIYTVLQCATECSEYNSMVISIINEYIWALWSAIVISKAQSF